MDRIIRDIAQGSREWMALRVGKIGGSRISDLLTEGRGGAESLTKRKYKNELIRERLTGRKLDTYKTPAMQRGIDLEPMARAWYEVKYNTFVDQVAIVLHPSIDGAGLANRRLQSLSRCRGTSGALAADDRRSPAQQ